MKSFGNRVIPTDNDIKSMLELIRKCGGEQVKSDVGNKTYPLNKLGDLGEQYIKCLFKDTSITKLPQRNKPTPDFKVNINGKEFLLEVKTVSNLYKSPLQLLFEITEGEKNNQTSNKLKNLLENYDFSVDPFEIHREDERKFKEELKKKFKDIRLPTERFTFKVKGKLKEYKISIKPKNKKIEGPFSVFIGWSPNKTKTLSNIVYKKFKQIGGCDILAIILLNKTIDRDDLIDFFYRQIELSLQLVHEISKNPSIPTIIQYQYRQTIWGSKFKDEQGRFHNMDERLKCVIVIYPYLKTSLIFPSIKYFENFSAPEYLYLKTILEANKLKCVWGLSRD